MPRKRSTGGTRASSSRSAWTTPRVLVYALANIGAVEFSRGRRKVERSWNGALSSLCRAGLEEHVGRALLASLASRRNRLFALATATSGRARVLQRPRSGLVAAYLLAYRARSELDQGRWAEAVDSAEVVLRDPGPHCWRAFSARHARARAGPARRSRPSRAARPGARARGSKRMFQSVGPWRRLGRKRHGSKEAEAIAGSQRTHSSSRCVEAPLVAGRARVLALAFGNRGGHTARHRRAVRASDLGRLGACSRAVDRDRLPLRSCARAGRGRR